MTIPNNLTVLFVSLALSAVLTVTAQAGGDKWALLIGVDKCKAVGELTVCSADALAMKSALERIGYPAKQITLLVDNQSDIDTLPTIGNVERAITRLAGVAEADDTVLFFFSGHGVTCNGASLLVPTDGDLTKGVSLTWIKDEFSACKAKEKVMILDACHSGGAKGVSGITPDLKTSGNLVMLLSCEKDQISWPDAKGQHSVFTAAVLEGLSGKAANADRKVTHLSLADYVRRSVKGWTFENKKNAQTPVLVADASGDIVLADIALMKPMRSPVKEIASITPAAGVDNGKVNAELQQRRRDEKAANQKRPLPSKSTVSEQNANSPRSMEKLTGDGRTEVAALKQKTKQTLTPSLKGAREPNPGDTETFDLGGGVKLELAWCPAGSFTMGSPESEAGRQKDETQHRVTLTKGYWMGKTEVTQRQWEAVTGSNPSNFKEADLPVETVSWDDCQEFVGKLNQKLGGGRFRLPTEAEWEYACRAGTTGPYAGELDGMGWLNANSGKTSHAVGQKRSNAWGLYDMHGSLWEWCQDWYGDYPSGSVTDPTVPGSGKKRVLRGGCCGSDANTCRSAFRSFNLPPGVHSPRLGLRLARDPL